MVTDPDARDIGDGVHRTGWKDTGLDPEMLTTVAKLIGEGNLVVSYSKSVMSEEAVAAFNLWRLSEGRIVEHWSNIETIAPRSEWANSGKF